MSKPICKICTGYLPDYVDGKLDAEMQRRMREHLDSSPECAAAARQLQELFSRILTRDDPIPDMPDPASFLVAVNAGIDTRAGRHSSFQFDIRRPAFLLPAIASVVLLIIVGLSIMPVSGPTNPESVLFPGLLTQADVDRIDESGTLTPLTIDLMLSDIAIGGEPAFEYLPSVSGTDLIDEAVDSSLLESIPYSAVISAGLDYLSADEVLENLSEGQYREIAADLEKQPFTLL